MQLTSRIVSTVARAFSITVLSTIVFGSDAALSAPLSDDELLQDILSRWSEDGNGGRDSITLFDAVLIDKGTIETAMAFSTQSRLPSTGALACYSFHQKRTVGLTGLVHTYTDRDMCIARVVHPDGRRLKQIDDSREFIGALQGWLDEMTFRSTMSPPALGSAIDAAPFLVAVPLSGTDPAADSMADVASAVVADTVVSPAVFPVVDPNCLAAGSVATLEGLVTTHQTTVDGKTRTEFLLSVEEPVCVMVDPERREADASTSEAINRFHLTYVSTPSSGLGLRTASYRQVKITGTVMSGTEVPYSDEHYTISVEQIRAY